MSDSDDGLGAQSTTQRQPAGDARRPGPLSAGVPEASSRPGVRGSDIWPALATLAIVSSFFLASATNRLNGDTWFDLCFGRDIVRRGLPTHDSFTVLGRGADWINVQWLAHLCWYGVERLGGPFGLVLFRLALLLGALALVLGVATRESRSKGRVAFAGLVAAVLIVRFATARAQAFAEILFAAEIVLLTGDRPRLRRQTWLVVPLCAVWTNVHGSCLLGVGIIALAGLARGIDAWRGGVFRPNVHLRDAALFVTSGIALFVSPYGSGIARRHLRMAFDSRMRHYITEWQPPAWNTAPEALVIAATLLVLLTWRARRVDVFRGLLVASTSVLTLFAVRNVSFLGYAIALNLPMLLDDFISPNELRFEWRYWRSCAVVFSVLAATLACRAPAQLRRPDMMLPASVAALTSRAAGPRGLVFSEESDRLVWLRPELAGRVAFDARTDFVSPQDWRWIIATRAAESWALERLAQQYSVVVVRASDWQPLARALATSPRWRLLTREAGVAVFMVVGTGSTS